MDFKFKFKDENCLTVSPSSEAYLFMQKISKISMVEFMFIRSKLTS